VFVAVEELNQSPEVEWACPNTAFQPEPSSSAIYANNTANEELWIEAEEDTNSLGVFPNDEYFPKQWHLHNTGQSGGTPDADINAPEAWEITTGDPNIIIAVVDCGVESSHPDLISSLGSGHDFIDDDDLPDPSINDWWDSHGTACAGLIAAEGNNEIGVTGVTWNCKIMPIRIYGTKADGTAVNMTQAEKATALRWTASQGADILSNSWGQGSNPAPIIHSAVKDITRVDGIGRNGKGCIVLFASGNDSAPTKWYPQKYPEVITVGGTDHNDLYVWYGSYGPELDVTAPSGGGLVFSEFDKYLEECKHLSTDLLWTTDILGDAGDSIFNENSALLDYTEKFVGTSGACPIAAGVAALVLSIEPDLTNDEVRHYLEQSAKDLGDPGWDEYYGWGRVDARAALDMVLAKRCDLNNDWKVDIDDLLVLIEFWRTAEPSADIAPATKRDGIVDEQDVELLMRYWQVEIPEIDPTDQ
jgi:subtilisin family serine protease